MAPRELPMIFFVSFVRRNILDSDIPTVSVTFRRAKVAEERKAEGANGEVCLSGSKREGRIRPTGRVSFIFVFLQN